MLESFHGSQISPANWDVRQDDDYSQKLLVNRSVIRVFWQWIPSITNIPPQTNGIQKDDLTLDPMCDFSYSVVPFSVMFIPVLYFFLHISFKEFLVPRVRVLVSISHHHCNHHQTKKDSAHCQTNRLLALFLFLSLVVCIGFCRRFWWCVSFPVDWARSC